MAVTSGKNGGNPPDGTAVGDATHGLGNTGPMLGENGLFSEGTEHAVSGDPCGRHVPVAVSHAEEDVRQTTTDMNSAVEAVYRLVDSSECQVTFNVMPERPIKETLRMREFRVGSTWIEAEFDRTYYSSMINSPSHLTFVAALVQMQKVTYVYSCHRFGLDPNVEVAEKLKIWPTEVFVDMRDLVRDERALVHRMEFTRFRRLDARRHLATAVSRIGVLKIHASAMIVLLTQP
jgi:hypothetical protein